MTNTHKTASRKKELLIFVPTYNERTNVGPLIRAIKKERIKNSAILFIDDNSPDGTGRVLDKLSQADAKLSVIHRKRKMGVGSAHLQALLWAYKNKYQKLITMDCDFTHNPSYIKRMLPYSDKFDLVITSRYLKKGSLRNWSLARKSMTFIGHFFTRLLLGLNYDASGAYRLYNLKTLDRKIFKLVKSTSYSFFFESLYLIKLNRYQIKEIPIFLISRVRGQSKMKISDVLNNAIFLLNLFIETSLNGKRYIIK